MFRSLLLTLPLALLPVVAHGADVRMGDVTLTLPTPSGQCELNPNEPADKRMIGVVTQVVSTVGNDLLGMSVDCGELTDWRAGRRPLISHLSQYQTQKARRTSVFSVAEALSACNDIRTRGEQINAGVLPTSKEAVAKAAKNMEFQDQSLIGVMGDDPNGCYVGLVQKLKAENGTNLVQVNLFFIGSIKEREIYFYMVAPYENESSAADVLVKEQAHIAVLKSANGL